MPRLKTVPSTALAQHDHIHEKLQPRTKRAPTCAPPEHSMHKMLGKSDHYQDKTHSEMTSEEDLDQSEASLHLDFTTGELREVQPSMGSDERFLSNSSHHDLIPVNRSRNSQVEEEIYSRGAALPHKTEHSSEDKTLPTCSLTGSASSFYEINVPNSPDPYVKSYYATQVKVEERSYHYSSEEVTYLEGRRQSGDYSPGRRESGEYSGQPDDRWGFSPSCKHAPAPSQRRSQSPRRERVPAQRSSSKKSSRISKRCSQPELASITQPPSSPRGSQNQSRSASPRPPYSKESSYRKHSRSASPRPPYSRQNSYHKSNSDDLSLTVSVISTSTRRVSAVELASVCSPNDNVHVSPNASWSSRRCDFSPSNSLLGSPHNSFCRPREQLAIQQQHSFRSRQGDGKAFHQQSRSSSFRSTVREETQVLNQSLTISANDLSSVLNSSFQRLNQSFKSCSQKGRSPHSSFRQKEDMSGLLDHSLMFEDDDGFRPHTSYGPEEYTAHESYRGEEAARRSSRNHPDDRLVHSPKSSYRSQRAEEEHDMYNRHNSYREQEFEEHYKPNPNSSYRSHQEEHPVLSRQGSYRSQGNCFVLSRQNSYRSQRGEDHSRHSSPRGQEHEMSPPVYRHSRPEPYSPHGSFRSQQGGGPNQYSEEYGGLGPEHDRNSQEHFSPHDSFHSHQGGGFDPQSSQRNEWPISRHNHGAYPDEAYHSASNSFHSHGGNASFSQMPHRGNGSHDHSDRRGASPGQAPHTPPRSRSGRSNTRPLCKRENSWKKNSVDEAHWRNRFEHNRPSFGRASSWKHGRPAYQRESSYSSRNSQGGHPSHLHQRQSSFGYDDHQAQANSDQKSFWVDRTPSNVSRDRREEMGFHRSQTVRHTASNLSSYSRESFSRYTETNDASHRMHGQEVPSGRGKKLPPRSKSDHGGRFSGSSRSRPGKSEPRRLQSDISDLTELTKGTVSVGNHYSTIGGDDGGPVMVEVFPGVEVPLRRTQETQEAIANNFYRAVSCMACCNMDLYAIADVAYFVCPTCKTICNVEDDCFNGRPVDRHGLGLGFTGETLFCMQAEIMGASSPARAPPKTFLRSGTR